MLAFTAVFALGCEAPSAERAPAADSPSPADTETADRMLAHLERTVTIAKEKFVSLAQATPEENYAWRPMDGIRSVGDVFLHVAADNWYGPALMDIASPPDVGVTTEGATVRAYQDRELSKAQIVEELERSFEHIAAAVETTRGRMDQETALRDLTITYGDLWVRLVTHMHEHLGQSIAYARTNGIVPPWNR